jgi:hypothetical protein
VEAVLSFVSIIVLVGVLSSLGARLATRRQGAMWVWDRSTPIGWILIVLGVALIAYGFAVDRGGNAMSTKLGLGSLFLIAGTWMIW